MIKNLPESFFYNKLPSFIKEVDPNRFIWAFIGGFQDRVEDIRSGINDFIGYTSRILDTEDNAVLVSYVTESGNIVVRSLLIDNDTPIHGDLVEWASQEMDVDKSSITNAVLGVDILRKPESDLVRLLSAGLGAVIYTTLEGRGLSQKSILKLFFSRIKIKGTDDSIRVLGKILGFDDVIVSPLWGRVSPRYPLDPGDSVNDADFDTKPKYYPDTDGYDPNSIRDGAAYEWESDFKFGPNLTDFIVPVVNGNQPWIKAIQASDSINFLVGDNSYVLSGGGQHIKARVDTGNGVIFESLVEGESSNGLEVRISGINGSSGHIAMSDRLSSIKYRTSYFDVIASLNEDAAIKILGTTSVFPNSDLITNPSLTSDGVAASPYRPWEEGIIRQGSVCVDYIVRPAGEGITVYSRNQAGIDDVQYNQKNIPVAQSSLLREIDEVSPATRNVRKVGFGFLFEENAIYASYTAESRVLSTVQTVNNYQGTLSSAPDTGFLADFRVDGSNMIQLDWAGDGSSLYTLQAKESPSGPWIDLGDVAGNNYVTLSVFLYTNYRLIGETGGTIIPTESLAVSSVSLYGERESDSRIVFRDNEEVVNVVFNPLSNSYEFSISGPVVDGWELISKWYPTTTEVVRDESFILKKPDLVFAAIGNFGFASASQTSVANLVKSWNPEAIFTLGNNNYPDGNPLNLVSNLVDYSSFIDSKRFFPSLGVKDYDSGPNIDGYLDYLKPPNNDQGDGRYYSIKIWNVEFFVLNVGFDSSSAIPSNTVSLEPNGIGQDSAQFKWLSSKLNESSAHWKIVILPLPPYTSSTITDNSYPGFSEIRRNYHLIGVDAVLSGHVGGYERIVKDGIPYIVSGIGGALLDSYTTPYMDGSSVRYSANYGALKIISNEHNLRFEGYSLDGIIDTYTIFKNHTVGYQERPEDQFDNSLILEIADGYDSVRPTTVGGEDYDPRIDVSRASNRVIESYKKCAVIDTRGLLSSMEIVSSPDGNSRVITREISVINDDSQLTTNLVAYRGLHKNLNEFIFDEDLSSQLNLYSDTRSLFQGDYEVYKVGVVGGVLVADHSKFYGEHHRNGLVAWFPFNDHPDGNTGVRDASKFRSDLDTRGEISRVFDNDVGFCGILCNNLTEEKQYREIGDSYSFSFWVKPGALLAYGGSHGLINVCNSRISSLNDGNYLIVDVSHNGTYENYGSIQVDPSIWNFVCLTLDQSGTLGIGSGDLDTTLSMSHTWTGYSQSNIENSVSVSSGTRCHKIHDFRIWNTAKNNYDAENIRYYSPGTHGVDYPFTGCEEIDTGDVVGLKVLRNGWVVPAPLPPATRFSNSHRIVRYDSNGLYVGDSRKELTGIGGNKDFGNSFNIGDVNVELSLMGYYPVDSISGVHGGVNDVFIQEFGSISYLKGTSTPSGMDYVTIGLPSGSVWPRLQQDTNPAREFVWMRGSMGDMYQVSISPPNTYVVTPVENAMHNVPEFVVIGRGTNVFYDIEYTYGSSEKTYDEGLSAEEFILSRDGTHVEVGWTDGGLDLVQIESGSYADTPILHMKSKGKVIERKTGDSLLRSWINPNGMGTQLGLPMLDENGNISFENSSDLLAGNYTLYLAVENTDSTFDSLFDGYRVEIRVGSNVKPARLAKDGFGYNYAATDTVRLSISENIVGPWILSIDYLNYSEDIRRSTRRRLSIKEFSFEYIKSDVYRIEINNYGTKPYMDLTSSSVYGYDLPGGWVRYYNNDCDFIDSNHEVRLLSKIDLNTSLYPLGDKLSNLTGDKLERLRIMSGSLLLPDSVEPTMDVFTTLTVT